MNLFRIKTFLIVVFLCNSIFAQRNSHFQFIENKGQWEQNYQYKTIIPGGEMYLYKHQIVYDFFHQEQKASLLDAYHHRENTSTDAVDAHAVFLNFTNASSQTKVVGNQKQSFYFNYFKGNKERWKGNIPIYEQILYSQLYDNIDLKFYTDPQTLLLKYDFIVKPNGSPSQIQWKYEGAEQISLKNNVLYIKTSVNEIVEQRPYAYQVINNKQVEIECKYILKKNTVSFQLGKYDPNYELIIDPALIFSSYSGSYKDNWGFTATYDYKGHLYGGGIVFGGGAHPSKPGAYSQTYGGGSYDILLEKYSPSGNNLVYYTYLGGNRGEAPYSVICNQNNELYVLGTTGSANFPATSGVYQSTFKGGPMEGVFTSNGIDYPQGSDLFISKFSEDGTQLLASTFLGGTGNDGINKGSALMHNYADEFRGEIILDNNSNVYITSSTKSTDFPTVNAVQNTNGGGQDAIVSKLNSSLTNLVFSTYLGGSAAEAGYSLQLNTSNEIYITGGTMSSNFPTTNGTLNPTFKGSVDGFITKLSPAGNTILASTFIGTASYDQTYAIQLDQNQDVYVVGQTTGAYPVSSGVYNNPNSSTFIQKLNPSLSSSLLSTRIGKASTRTDLVPTAFLIDECNNIYISGWGGEVNASLGGGNVSGFPVTPGCFQATTSGSDFYLIVLGNNASSLLYATFFGGNRGPEHVDGGTSRFDKKGIVYQSVCAGCGRTNDFPVTTGAWSTQNRSENCNMGVFKFDISEFSALLEPTTPTNICIDGSVTLKSLSTGNISNIVWDFGDGSPTQTGNNVTHTYTTPGTYTAYLIAYSNGVCSNSDTDSVVINVKPFPVANVAPVQIICPNDTIQLHASGGTSYIWNPDATLFEWNIANPHASPSQNTTYTVRVSDECGADTASVLVKVHDFSLQLKDNDTICKGDVLQLLASGAVHYSWVAHPTLSNTSIPNPVVNPTSSTSYYLTATDINGCILKDTIHVAVLDFPIANAGEDKTICKGDRVQLNGSGGTHYSWSPSSSHISNPLSSSPIVFPNSSQDYILAASNVCGTDYDTVSITVIVVKAEISNDTIICPGMSAHLSANGGISYFWSPSGWVDDIHAQNVIATPNQPTTFSAIVSDENGCKDTAYVFVDMHPQKHISAGQDIIIEVGDLGQLLATGDVQPGNINWSPNIYLNCDTCINPTSNPEQSIKYTLTLIDENRCKFEDTVWVYIPGRIWIPNTFTPTGDKLNETFRPKGIDITTFSMQIFNRWGERVSDVNLFEDSWDGTFNGKDCPQGTYAYKIEYTDIIGRSKTVFGHVNLIR